MWPLSGTDHVDTARFHICSQHFALLCKWRCHGEEAERVVKKHVFCIKSAQSLVKAAGYGKTADMPPLLVSLLSVRLPERAALCRNAPTSTKESSNLDAFISRQERSAKDCAIN